MNTSSGEVARGSPAVRPWVWTSPGRGYNGTRGGTMRQAVVWVWNGKLSEAQHVRALAREAAELKLSSKPVDPSRVFRGGPKKKRGK
jgi:hypothetical protein